MAGHRQVTGKPKQAVARWNSWRDRIGRAETSEQFFDVASDWYRATVTHVPEPRRTELLNEAARWLSGRADELCRELIP